MRLVARFRDGKRMPLKEVDAATWDRIMGDENKRWITGFPVYYYRDGAKLAYWPAPNSAYVTVEDLDQ